jgi:hypothetical protein
LQHLGGWIYAPNTQRETIRKTGRGAQPGTTDTDDALIKPSISKVNTKIKKDNRKAMKDTSTLKNVSSESSSSVSYLPVHVGTHNINYYHFQNKLSKVNVPNQENDASITYENDEINFQALQLSYAIKVNDDSDSFEEDVCIIWVLSNVSF